jgi:hypothetical protein
MESARPVRREIVARTFFSAGKDCLEFGPAGPLMKKDAGRKSRILFIL